MGELILPISLILISGFLNGESENILMYQFNSNWRKPLFPNWEWYVSNHWKYDNAIIRWLMRYPLSFLKDGFHFTKSFGIVLFIAGISLLGLPIVYNVLIAYIILGIGFNIGYHT
jgi:hypothetical protein